MKKIMKGLITAVIVVVFAASVFAGGKGTYRVQPAKKLTHSQRVSAHKSALKKSGNKKALKVRKMTAAHKSHKNIVLARMEKKHGK